MTALALAPNGARRPMLSNILDEWFGNEFSKSNQLKLPSTNISEHDDHFLLELAVPGLKKDDIDIKVDSNMLTISSQNQTENTVSEENYRIKEFSRYSFTKSFNLGETIEIEDISAKCEDGILTLNLPKKEEAKKQVSRSIEIK